MDRTAGTYLRRHLDDQKLTQVEAAPQLGCSAKHLNQVLNNRVLLSIDLAISFERLIRHPGLAEQALIRQIQHELRSRGVHTSV